MYVPKLSPYIRLFNNDFLITLSKSILLSIYVNKSVKLTVMPLEIINRIQTYNLLKIYKNEYHEKKILLKLIYVIFMNMPEIMGGHMPMGHVGYYIWNIIISLLF